MSTNKYAKKTYYGAASLVTGLISVFFSAASYSLVFFNLSMDTFNLLNNLTALVFCSLTPITILLGVLGYTRKNDSKSASLIAIILVTIPFLILFTSLIRSFLR